MAFFRNRYRSRRNRPEQPEIVNPLDPGSAGSESAYLKSLIDSRAKVTVVLITGERLRGRIRYYDRDCFSIGLTGGGPKIFLRKSSVSHICED